MKVSKEEILHIAKLADLEIKDEEIEKYALNLQDILDFAEVVNNAPVDGLDVTVGANEKKNVFRTVYGYFYCSSGNGPVSPVD